MINAKLPISLRLGAFIVCLLTLFACAPKEPVRTAGPTTAARMPDSRPVIVQPAPERRIGEVRGLWVTRFQLVSPESIDRAVDMAAANGFNTLFVQVRGRGDAFYASTIEPRAEILAGLPDFDPLAYVTARAHASNLAVHAWVNSFYVASLKYPSADPAHVVNAHPERLMVPREAANELYGMDPRRPEYVAAIVNVSKRNPKELEGLYTSPSNPEVIRDLAAACAEIALKYNVDGIHLDFIRYPNPDFDYSRTALEAFRAWLALNASPVEQARIFNGQNTVLDLPGLVPQRWDEFRREQTAGAVRAVRNTLRRVRADLPFSAAVFADYADARSRRFQDWAAWMNAGLLDALCPMAYTLDTAKFGTQIAAARSFTPNSALWSGIGSWRISPESTQEKIGVARASGSDGFILFSYDEFARNGANGTASLGAIGEFMRQLDSARAYGQNIIPAPVQ